MSLSEHLDVIDVLSHLVFTSSQSLSDTTTLSIDMSLMLSFLAYVYVASNVVVANMISQPDVQDDTGKSLCIGDLRCFLNTDQAITVLFNLTLDSPATDFKVHITIEQVDIEEPLVDKVLYLCCDQDSGEVALAEDPCEGDVIPARADYYPISYTIQVPFFKDMAMLTVSGPDDLAGVRGLVSYHSSHPPIKIPNCSAGPC